MWPNKSGTGTKWTKMESNVWLNGQLWWRTNWSWFIPAVFIVVVATYTRLWYLGAVPTGLTWDEAFLGYVGKMVITTGYDEHGQHWPRVFQSFGDYKAPAAVYLTGIFTTLGGLTPRMVRLPFALAGILAVILLMLLAHKLWRQRWYSLLAGWLLAISPWHTHFSRVAFESGLSLTALLAGLYGWLVVRATKVGQRSALTAGWILIVLASAGSIYLYHAGKILVPLLWLILGIYEWRAQPEVWRRRWREVATAILTTAVLLLPFAVTVLNGGALERATQTTLLTREAMTNIDTWLRIATQWWQHWGLDFLVRGDTPTLRHGLAERGVLLWTQYALLLTGITVALIQLLSLGTLSQGAHPASTWWQRWFRWSPPPAPTVPASLWLVIAAAAWIPAAIGQEVPHANRALFALVPLIILMVEALRQCQREMTHLVFASFTAGAILLATLEWASFWRSYTQVYPTQSAAAWLDGHAAVVRAVQPYVERQQRIHFTDTYGQPEIFWAFYLDLPAEVYRARQFGRVRFGRVSTLDRREYDVVVAGQESSLPFPLVQEITRADGSVAFRIYELP